MSPEDAAELIVSCGVFQPEWQAALAATATTARAAPRPVASVPDTVSAD